MSEKDQFPSDAAERFQVRLPPGLRDRIKAYAEKHGRSMNTEIVRVLQREFPEPWSLADRITQLVALSHALTETIGNDELDKLGATLLATVEGVAFGRVTGIDDETREHVADWLNEWNEQLETITREDPRNSFDAEEKENWEKTRSTAKFVDVPKADK